MAALLSAVAHVFRDTSAAVWRAGFVALARVAQPAGAALLVLAGVAKLLAIGQRGFVRLPVVGVVTAPLATSIAVVEVVAGLWLAHAGRRSVLRIFACLYGVLALLAFASFVTGEEECGCFGDFSLPPVAQGLIDALVAVGLSGSGRFVGSLRGRLQLVPVTLCWAVVGAGIVTLATTPSVDGAALAGQRQYLRIESLVGRTFPVELFEPVRGRTRSLTQGWWLVVVGSSDCVACKRLLSAARQRIRHTEWKLSWCVADRDWSPAAAAVRQLPEVVVVIRPSPSLTLVGNLPVVLAARAGMVVGMAHGVEELLMRTRRESKPAGSVRRPVGDGRQPVNRSDGPAVRSAEFARYSRNFTARASWITVFRGDASR